MEPATAYRTDFRAMPVTLTTSADSAFYFRAPVVTTRETANMRRYFNVGKIVSADGLA